MKKKSISNPMPQVAMRRRSAFATLFGLTPKDTVITPEKLPKHFDLKSMDKFVKQYPFSYFETLPLHTNKNQQSNLLLECAKAGQWDSLTWLISIFGSVEKTPHPFDLRDAEGNTLLDLIVQHSHLPEKNGHTAAKAITCYTLCAQKTQKVVLYSSPATPASSQPSDPSASASAEGEETNTSAKPTLVELALQKKDWALASALIDCHENDTPLSPTGRSAKLDRLSSDLFSPDLLSNPLQVVEILYDLIPHMERYGAMKTKHSDPNSLEKKKVFLLLLEAIGEHSKQPPILYLMKSISEARPIPQASHTAIATLILFLDISTEMRPSDSVEEHSEAPSSYSSLLEATDEQENNSWHSIFKFPHDLFQEVNMAFETLCRNIPEEKGFTTNRDGNTPLHFAAQQADFAAPGNYAAFNRPLVTHAVLTLRNNIGHTPLAMVIENAGETSIDFFVDICLSQVINQETENLETASSRVSMPKLRVNMMSFNFLARLHEEILQMTMETTTNTETQDEASIVFTKFVDPGSGPNGERSTSTETEFGFGFGISPDSHRRQKHTLLDLFYGNPPKTPKEVVASMIPECLLSSPKAKEFSEKAVKQLIQLLEFPHFFNFGLLRTQLSRPYPQINWITDAHALGAGFTSALRFIVDHVKVMNPMAPEITALDENCTEFLRSERIIIAMRSSSTLDHSTEETRPRTASNPEANSNQNVVKKLISCFTLIEKKLDQHLFRIKHSRILSVPLRQHLDRDIAALDKLLFLITPLKEQSPTLAMLHREFEKLKEMVMKHQQAGLDPNPIFN